MVEGKAFLAIPKHQYRVIQCGEHDYSATNKMNGINTSIQVCIIPWMNFDYKDNGWKKSFSCKSKASMLCIPIWRTWLQCPLTKRIEIIASIQVCLISQINFDYRENGGKKNFSCKSKASISCIPIWRTWLLAKRMEIITSIQVWLIS